MKPTPIEDFLFESDIAIIGEWPSGTYYEDDQRAAAPEPGSLPPRPESYFAPAAAFAPLTSGGSTLADAHDPAISSRQFLENRLLAKYLRSRWIKRGTHR
jgi:hypothetical protein